MHAVMQLLKSNGVYCTSRTMELLSLVLLLRSTKLQTLIHWVMSNLQQDYVNFLQLIRVRTSWYGTCKRTFTNRHTSYTSMKSTRAIQITNSIEYRKYIMYNQYRMTCPDQSFFTAFALQDNTINLYLMNFKKGSQITKDKLKLENKKSLKILTMLPMNLIGEDAPLLWVN